jgi:hypothetical protein
MPNQNQQKPLEVLFTQGKTKEVGNGFLTLLSAIVKRGDIPQANKLVVLSEGANIITSVFTNAVGEATHEYFNVIQRSGEAYEVRATCSGQVKTLTIVLPKKEKKVKPVIEADRISLRSWNLKKGVVKMVIRVIDVDGNAVKNTKVKLVFNARLEEVTTDNLGFAKWRLPDKLKSGQTARIFATVNNIAKEVELKIHNAPKPKTKVSFKDLSQKKAFKYISVISICSLLFFIASFAIIFNKTGIEKANNGDIAGLILILADLLCTIPWIVFAIYVAWYFLLSGTKKAKETWDYNSSRIISEHSSDPFIEHAANYIKTLTKKEHEPVVNSAPASGSGSPVTEGNMRRIDLENEVITQGTFKLGAFLWNFFKKK